MSSVIHIVHGLNSRLELCGQWVFRPLTYFSCSGKSQEVEKKGALPLLS